MHIQALLYEVLPFQTSLVGIAQRSVIYNIKWVVSSGIKYNSSQEKQSDDAFMCSCHQKLKKSPHGLGVFWLLHVHWGYLVEYV